MDYIFSVHKDCPDIVVTLVINPDYNLNSVGARSVVEIGLAGVAVTITNSLYYATGVWVRKLPVRIETPLVTPHDRLRVA